MKLVLITDTAKIVKFWEPKEADPSASLITKEKIFGW